jgi:hypothetical protein
MKKCPPGVICIENITLLILFIILIIFIYFIHINLYKNNNNNNNREKDIIINNTNDSPNPNPNLFIPSYPYNNLSPNVLQNPYVPPLSDNRYFVPINVSTNIGSVSTEYRQLGILLPLNSSNKDNILPLMGRPLFVNRQKYQYYTISNQHNNVKLPILVKGRSGTNEYGVDQIFDGDSVYIEGYNSAFKVSIYDNDTIKYLPSL